MSSLVSHNFHIYTPTGERLAVLPDGKYLSFSLGLRESEVGVLELVLPGDFEITFLVEDGIIEFYRSYANGPFILQGDTGFFIRKITWSVNANGEETVTVLAFSALDLLRRHIIPYVAGSSYSDKVGIPWATMLKEIVSENYGSAVVNIDRDLSPWLQIEASAYTGAAFTKAMAWRRVLETMLEIVEDVRNSGLYGVFDVIRPDPNFPAYFEYRIYIGSRGVDHSSDSSSPVIVSRERLNLQEPSLMFDWTEESNYIYAAGQGQEEDRIVETAQDDARINVSPFNRCEYLQDARNGSTSDFVKAEANAALEERRPKIMFSGVLTQTESCIYDLHWRFGDIVTAEYRNRSIDCHVYSVTIQGTNPSGTEIVRGYLRSETDVW